MIRSRFEFSPHCAWKTNGTSCWKQPAMTAPQRLKMPPISAVAARISESWVWKVIARGTPT